MEYIITQIEIFIKTNYIDIFIILENLFAKRNLDHPDDKAHGGTDILI